MTPDVGRIIHKGTRLSYRSGHQELGYLKFSFPSDAAKDRNVVIDYIYVKPQYRRRGIATLLLGKFLGLYKNKVWVSLWTGRLAEKDGSWFLYKKLGFGQLAFQADYYAPGVGTRLFAKRLSPPDTKKANRKELLL